jgi:hypothetical protein
LHDLVFLVVVGADALGRLAMVGLILRAHLQACRHRGSLLIGAPLSAVGERES